MGGRRCRGVQGGLAANRRGGQLGQGASGGGRANNGSYSLSWGWRLGSGSGEEIGRWGIRSRRNHGTVVVYIRNSVSSPFF